MTDDEQFIVDFARFITDNNLSLDGFEFVNEDGELKVRLWCSDLFTWGCSDCEEFSRDDFDALLNAISDLERTGEYTESLALSLLCCRKRGERPQGAWFVNKKRHHKTNKLFMDAGPHRPVGPGNPLSIEDAQNEY